MKSPRTPDNEEPAAERACDFRPVDKGFTEEMALAEAERCLNCKKPFCVEGCPVNINIPRFIEQIRAKDFGGALDTIREDSMLPAICGRVCPQENQCEGKCVRGIKGEAVGIIGSNGAGKSTLLKLLTHVTAPTSGDIDLYGRVASMLEVGTGFHPEMTGRENVYLNGAILGMTRAEIDAKMAEIIEFSEVGDFIDTPVKRYSSLSLIHI